MAVNEGIYFKAHISDIIISFKNVTTSEIFTDLWIYNFFRWRLFNLYNILRTYILQAAKILPSYLMLQFFFHKMFIIKCGLSLICLPC